MMMKLVEYVMMKLVEYVMMKSLVQYVMMSSLVQYVMMSSRRNIHAKCLYIRAAMEKEQNFAQVFGQKSGCRTQSERKA